MVLEDLMRRACKRLFLKLKNDMSLKKTYRAGYFVIEMQSIDTYRNIYVEIHIEHELGDFKLICGKEYLTEEEIKKNKEAIEQGKEPPHKRGDKPYNLVGLVDDGFEGKDLTPANINARLYHFFDDLKRFYQMSPEETKPALLSINVISEKKEDFYEYAEKTKVHYLDPTQPIMSFLLEFSRYVDEHDKEKKETEKMETEELGKGKKEK